MCATTWTTEPMTIAQPVALWKVMFLSNGMTSFKGVRRMREIKLRQTGRRMKATSTWRQRAAVRAIAARANGQDGRLNTKKALANGSDKCWRGKRKVHTEGDTKDGTSGDRVVLELIIHEPKGNDETVKEDEYEEEDSPSTLVDHPVIPFLAPGLGLVDDCLCGGGGV